MRSRFEFVDGRGARLFLKPFSVYSLAVNVFTGCVLCLEPYPRLCNGRKMNSRETAIERSIYIRPCARRGRLRRHQLWLAVGSCVISVMAVCD